MSGRDTHIRSQAVRHMVQARRKFESEPTETLSFLEPIVAATRERLGKIERLLKEGRDAEAILLANVGAWSDTILAARVSKANFNPYQPRDEHTGRWTNTGIGSGDVHPENVQYRGHFHDSVAEYILNTLKEKGDKSIKNPRIMGINGKITIPDGIAVGQTAGVHIF